MLSLSQIEQWHDRRLLVLAGVPAKHLLDELLILLAELERNRQVVLGGIAVLWPWLEMRSAPFCVRFAPLRTTLRESLRLAAEIWKLRLGCLAVRKALELLRNAQGASLDDMVTVWCGQEACSALESGIRIDIKGAVIGRALQAARAPRSIERGMISRI